MKAKTEPKGKDIVDTVIRLHKAGYSTRDIERITDRRVSFATAARIIRSLKDNK